MDADPNSRPAVAERAATAGAELALESFRTDIVAETKSSKTDVVTQADRDAQGSRDRGHRKPTTRMSRSSARKTAR
jgi:hypothetical protein